jgi:hypothetical protein
MNKFLRRLYDEKEIVPGTGFACWFASQQANQQANKLAGQWLLICQPLVKQSDT